MKKLRLLIIFGLILCVLAVCSCSKLPQLSSPSGVEIDMTDLTLNWDEVEGARMYTVSITDSAGVSSEVISGNTSYPLSELAEGDYTLKVKANGKEDESSDSPWSEDMEFTRDHETGLIFKLTADGTAYQVTAKGLATGDIVIPGKYRGKPVTEIGEKAFFNKSDVTSVVVGENVRSIGALAFANCSYVTSITLPEGLLSIGESAFSSCRVLAGELVIPDGVTAIPKDAFSYCSNITSVKLGSGLKSIGENAFADCKGIKSITVPDSVKELGEYAFSSCEGLTEIKLGSGIEHISHSAFSGAVLLTGIAIPDTVKSIGERAFYNCTSLADVSLGTGIEYIEVEAFRNTALWKNSATDEIYAGKWFIGCKNADAIGVNLKPDTVGIANYALSGFASLDTVILPDSTVFIGDGAFAESGVKNVVIGAGVKEIGANAFISCANLVTVILGSYDSDLDRISSSSLEEIGNYAFKDCAALEDIAQIPSTVKTVGSLVFRGSGIYDLTEGGLVYVDNWLVDYTEDIAAEITVKNGTVGISNYAFFDCKKINSVKLPSSVKTVGRGAFYDCANLRTVKLPKTLQIIDEYTFYRCYALKLFELELPSSLKHIGRSAFYKCGTVFYIGEEERADDVFAIPDSVETIGDFAFYASGLYVPADSETGEPEATYGIDILKIGNGVKSIGNSAFYGFASLKQLVLGDGVESIGEKAFYNCVRIETVTFGKSLKTIAEKAFYKCAAIQTVDLPDTVISIGDHAFYRCESIKTLDLGVSLESIGSFAFCGCKDATELRLPTTLTSVGKQAFRNWKSLASVIVSSNITDLGEHAFYGCKSLTVYTEFKSAPEGWHANWNSSYRPVVWSCNLSEEKDYIVSVEKSAGSVVNRISVNTFSAPSREGYTFVGWNTNSAATEAAYTAETLINAPDGRRLFAIWAENAAS